jgi:hypothetical protein
MAPHLSLCDDGLPRPPAGELDAADVADTPSVADVLAARCVLRPGETADSGGSGPGLLGRRSIYISGRGPE